MAIVKDKEPELVINRVKQIVDEESLSQMLDLHFMEKVLLDTSLGSEIPEYMRNARNEARAELCQRNCRDPTFWHTALSTGRLFDGERFTIPIEDKYPGCLALFPQKRD